MPILQADNVADLVIATLRDLGRGRWTDLAGTIQEYIALPNLLRRNRVGFGSGYGIAFNLMTSTSGAAANTGLFAVDKVNVGDVLTTGNVPWRHTNTNYAIDKREISMNRNPARIVEMIKVRRADAMIDLAKKMETNFWEDPPSDSETPFGLPYWVVEGAQGFGAKDPTNFSGGAANIVSTANRWTNYSDRYVSVTKTDLIRKVRKAATLTRFISPVKNPDYNDGDQLGHYTNYDVVGAVEELLEAQNDRLGRDIASMDGKLVFRRVPVTYVPHLDSDAAFSADDPWYGINWGVMKAVFLRGEWMRETGPIQAANQHNTLQVHVDLTYNFVAFDRRRLFKIDIA